MFHVEYINANFGVHDVDRDSLKSNSKQTFQHNLRTLTCNFKIIEFIYVDYTTYNIIIKYLVHLTKIGFINHILSAWYRG